MDDYLVEFATVAAEENSDCRFVLDNGRVLIPEAVKNYDGEQGQRVILNYTPLEGNVIKINFVSGIFTGVISTEGFPEECSYDPVTLRSAWVGGNYLNLIIETEYHSESHGIALFRNRASASVDLYFSHSSGDDPPGYPRVMYASFLLSDLRQPDGTPVPFRFFVSTYEGMKVVDLVL
jgi:hypothetical protein